MIRLANIVLLLSLPFTGLSQFNFGYELRNDIPVILNNDTLKMPWAGGLNNPQFEQFDLNFDGIEDLLVHEFDGRFLKCFTYGDSTGEYTWTPDCAKGFPDLDAHFVFLRDYNGDGKKDLFTSSNVQGWMWLYENTSTNNQFSFDLKSPGYGISYKDMGYKLYIGTPEGNLPSIIDVDEDGDLDIFVLKVDPRTNLSSPPPTVILIRNLSMETYGVPDSLVFEEENACWGKFAELQSSSGYESFDCTTPLHFGSSRHAGASTLTMLDLNGDDLLDILLSDQYESHLAAGINTTDNIDAELDVQGMDMNFPSYDEPVDIPSLVAAFHVDVDHDGHRDLVCTPNQVTNFLDTSINRLVDWYYRNHGTDGNPDFELEKKGFLSGEMIETGSHSHPAFGDVNADGLPDLVIGNQGYGPGGSTAYATLELYLNVGTANHSVFELAETNLGDIQQYQFNMTHPALADLTGDGYADLMVGDDQGNLYYFENSGSGGNYNFQLTEALYEGIDVGLNAHPSFFDFNVDNLPDLMIGNANGRIHYFENSGTAQSPEFSSSPTISNLGDIDLYQAFGGETTPFFTRAIDSTFGMYAFVSTANGPILFYGPITNIGGTYTPVDSIIVTAHNTSITGHDLQGDYRTELVIGQRTGGLYLMSRERNIKPGVKNVRAASQGLKVYPNPAGDEVVVLLTQKSASIRSIRLVDLGGRSFDRPVSSSTPHRISVAGLPAGFYSVVVTLDDGRILQSKLLKH